ncbi:MAG: Uma2 family endonuclease [Thermaceae bacterium]|nr:Uma2 family endonuclease [Thermaceae bacterium]
MFKLIPDPVLPEKYLELEKTASVRHEFVDGIAYAMAGASRTHNLLAGNMFTALRSLATGLSCRVFQTDMELRIEDDFFYPDLMVVCAPEPDDEYYETDPCILVEVLLESTKNTDLREKASTYRHIPSLQTYLIVDPNSKTIRHYFRGGDGNWQHQDVTDTGTVPLPCLNGLLDLAEVYGGVV